MSTITFEDQVVIVTGAGRGMGRTHALTLAARGARVVVNDADAAAADAVVAEIETAGGTAVVSPHPIGGVDAARSIVDLAVDRFGRIDALVNNAGFMRNGYIEQQTPEMLDSVLNVHLRGHFFLTQAAWPVMRAQQYGRVVMIGSGGGMFSMPAAANYAAAKAGLYGLMKALSTEGERHGILVNLILPGAATTITANEPLPEAAERLSKPGLAKIFATRRVPEGPSAMVGFLASRQCDVNGEAFVANSGVFARVFVGVGHGWVADEPSKVSMDDIVAHLGQIRSYDQFAVPSDDYEHLLNLARWIGWDGQ